MNILKVRTEKRRLGNFGERRAALYLWLHGYIVLERNYTGGEIHGVDIPEVDIIARKGDTIAIVEVKTRTVGKENPNEPRPASAVTPEKMRKIMQAASWYRAWHDREKKIRLDIIEVYVTEKNGRKKVADIRHLIGAYTKNTLKRRK